MMHEVEQQEGKKPFNTIQEGEREAERNNMRCVMSEKNMSAVPTSPLPMQTNNPSNLYEN